MDVSRQLDLFAKPKEPTLTQALAELGFTHRRFDGQRREILNAEGEVVARLNCADGWTFVYRLRTAALGKVEVA